MFRLFLFLAILLPAKLSAQWLRTNGLPASGGQSLLKYNQDSILCNIGSEVYLSTDDGQNWALIPQTGGVNLINAYTNGNVILMYHYYDSANELTYTDDFFQTVHKVYVPVKQIAFEFFVWNNYIHFTSEEGLFRSTDNGLSWQKINEQQFYFIQVLPDRILGFVHTQLYQSYDGGLSWDALPTIQPCGYPKGLLINRDTLLQFASGFQRSTDGGQTWEDAGSFGLHDVHQFLWHKGSIFAIKNSNFYRSDDQGSSWVLKILPADIGVVTQVISTEEALILSSYGKNAIYRSTDNGESWQPASSGIISGYGKLRKNDEKLYATAPSGLFRLKDDGFNWEQISVNFPFHERSHHLLEYLEVDNHWIAADEFSIKVSADNGQTWSESFVPYNQAWYGYYGVINLEVQPDKDIIATIWLREQVFHLISRDKGLSFEFFTNPDSPVNFNLVKVWIDRDSIYATNYDGKIFSSDDGMNWTLAAEWPQSLKATWQTEPRSAFFTFGDFMLLGHENDDIILSSDTGQNWQKINLEAGNQPFGKAPPSDILMYENHLFAACETGVWYSADKGITWTAWNEGLQVKQAYKLAVQDNFLWVSIENGGIWKRPLDEANFTDSPPKDDLLLSNHSAALHCFPNPVSQILNVENPEPGASLLVSDLYGRVVISQKLGAAGVVQVPVGHLPTGQYFLQIRGINNTYSARAAVVR